MADIFLSYASPDRPRAEKLKDWFEAAGWSVWIDRDIDLGEGWQARLQRELDIAKLVVVVWGADARRSEWVRKEALAALESNRLFQVHATGLPLLAPFDTLQAVRMQAWSGEPGHSERVKLLHTLADALGTRLPDHVEMMAPDEDPKAYRLDAAEAIGLAFHYCARQLESARLRRERGFALASDFEEIGVAFDALLALLRNDADGKDDREAALHRLMEEFLSQLQRLVPDPNALK
jgi:hypothetical protein